MHRDALGRCLETRYPPNRLHQRLPMMRAGPPHQRAIDIEENE